MKTPVLGFPACVALTEDGIQLFLRHHRKIRPIRLADNSLETGLVMEPVNAKVLQKMICQAYVSKVEIASAEFRSQQQEVIDLNKLIVYALLYERFANLVDRFLLAGDFVARWNLAHPSHPIDARARFGDQRVGNILVRHREEQERVSRELLARVRKTLERTSCEENLVQEEREFCYSTAVRFLDHLHASAWLLLMSARRDQESRALDKLGRLLGQYVQKAKVADYLSLIIMEIAAYQEREKADVAARRIFRAADGLRQAVDDDLRRQVLTFMEDRLYLTWHLRHGDLSRAVNPALQVDLIDRSYDFHFLKAHLGRRKSIDIRERSLADFYQQLPDSALGNELRAYYLSYLEEACSELRMPFASSVRNIGPDNLTVVTMTLNMK